MGKSRVLLWLMSLQVCMFWFEESQTWFSCVCVCFCCQACVKTKHAPFHSQHCFHFLTHLDTHLLTIQHIIINFVVQWIIAAVVTICTSPIWLFVLWCAYTVLKWRCLSRVCFISTTISQLSRNIYVTSSYRSRWLLSVTGICKTTHCKTIGVKSWSWV